MAKLLASAAALAFLTAAPAFGASATIGSSLSGDGNQNNGACSSGFECVAFQSNNGAPVAVAPEDGVITTWRVKSGSSAPVQLRVLRPAGGGTYTAIASGAVENANTGTTEFTASLPISKGDVVALANSTQALLYDNTPPAGYVVDYWAASMMGTPAFPDGTTGTPPGTATYELLMNATVTFDEADLAMAIGDSPDPVGVGQDLTYLLTISNGGPRPAKNASVTDTLPVGVTPKSATPSAGTCTNGTTVTCDLGTLASGAMQTVAIVVTPTAAGSIANAASVTSTTSDPNGANNATTVTTTVTEQQQETPKPAISAFAFKPARFRLGSFLPTAAAKKPPVGTTVSYVVADATAVTLRFQRLRKGKRPVAAGSLTRAAKVGINRFRFSGRLSAKRKLRPGRYRVTAAAKSATAKSAPLRKTITVLKH